MKKNTRKGPALARDDRDGAKSYDAGQCSVRHRRPHGLSIMAHMEIGSSFHHAVLVSTVKERSVKQFNKRYNKKASVIGLIILSLEIGIFFTYFTN